MAAWIPKNVVRVAKSQSACSASYTVQICGYSTEPRIIKNPTTASLKRGTGGRSSFNGVVCTVFGATGFLGKYVCNRLGKIGTQLIIPHRCDPYDCRQLKLCGDLGQVIFNEFHLEDEESIRKSIKYSNVVINLIGRDWETKNFKFNDVHVDGAARIARLCKEEGVERFIHLSCLNANPHPKVIFMKDGSGICKSKWEGEIAVRKEFPEATIIRPADIYGQADRFLDLYAHNWRHHLRTIPLYKKGEATEKQPIHASDVAAGIRAAVLDPRSAGQTYQFVGPKRYKLSGLVDWITRLVRHDAVSFGYRRMDLMWSPLFILKVTASEFISPSYPMANLHWEGLEKEHTTDVVRSDLPTLEDLGIIPGTIDERLPWEMAVHKKDLTYMADINEFDPPPPPEPVPNVFV